MLFKLCQIISLNILSLTVLFAVVSYSQEKKSRVSKTVKSTPTSNNSSTSTSTNNKNSRKSRNARPNVAQGGASGLFSINDSSVFEKDIEESETAPIENVGTAEIKRGVTLPLTDIYRVGAGDVLDIRLLNANTSESTLYTILESGILDYPLAGGPLVVSRLTPQEIGQILAAKIKLYKSPQVVVTVREFASHQVYISGLVDNPGTKHLKREAVPLFAILAETGSKPEAARVLITRANKQNLLVNLNDIHAETLIFPGDIIRVLGNSEPETASIAKFYFIGGDIAAPGQKNFHPGITLTQAILAANGTRKGNRVYVLRQNSDGLLVKSEFNLRKIKSGAEPDPTLQPGDRIEVY